MMGNNLWKARQGYCLGDRSQSWVAVPVLSFTQPARILLPCSTWRIFVSANSNSLGFYSFTSSFTSCFFSSFSCVSIIQELVSLTFLGYIHSWGAPKGSQVAIYFVDLLSRLACWVTCLQTATIPLSKFLYSQVTSMHCLRPQRWSIFQGNGMVNVFF